MTQLIAPTFSFIYSACALFSYYLMVHQQRLKGNPIAFYLKGTLITASIMFFLNGLAPLLFPSGSWGLTLVGNIPDYFLSVIAASFFAGITSFSVAPTRVFHSRFIINWPYRTCDKYRNPTNYNLKRIWDVEPSHS